MEHDALTHNGGHVTMQLADGETVELECEILQKGVVSWMADVVTTTDTLCRIRWGDRVGICNFEMSNNPGRGRFNPRFATHGLHRGRAAHPRWARRGAGERLTTTAIPLNTSLHIPPAGFGELAKNGPRQRRRRQPLHVGPDDELLAASSVDTGERADGRRRAGPRLLRRRVRDGRLRARRGARGRARGLDRRDQARPRGAEPDDVDAGRDGRRRRDLPDRRRRVQADPPLRLEALRGPGPARGSAEALPRVLGQRRAGLLRGQRLEHEAGLVGQGARQAPAGLGPRRRAEAARSRDQPRRRLRRDLAVRLRHAGVVRGDGGQAQGGPRAQGPRPRGSSASASGS